MKNMMKYIAVSILWVTLVSTTVLGQWRRVNQPATLYAQAPATTTPNAPAAQSQGEIPQARTQTTTPPARIKSRMTSDDLEAQMQRIADLTPITIGAPLKFEEMQGYYQSYNGWSGGINIPGSTYPAYSSMQPAKELPKYIQQELFEQYQRSGEFNPLIPATGHMAGNLDVLAAESKVGKGRHVMDNGRKVQIGPETWTTTKYVVVSSVGILDEQATATQFRGRSIVDILDSWGVFRGSSGSRVRQGLGETLGQTNRGEVKRRIVGVLYVSVVDLETRSVLKSSTGVAQIDYTEFARTDFPVVSKQTIRYVGAGTFAAQLVKSALYDEVDRDKSVEKYLRGKQAPQAKPSQKGKPTGTTPPALRGVNPNTTYNGVALSDTEAPQLKRRP